MSEETPETTASGDRWERLAPKARVVAVIAGIVGVLAAILSPILPVDYTKAEVSWPQNGSVANVAAPTVSFVPVSMNLSVPCSLGAKLPRSGGVLLSTVPEKGAEAAKVGLFVRVTEDSLQVTSRNVVLLDAPRAQAQSTAGCVVKIRGGDDGVHGVIENIPPAEDGSPYTFDIADPDKRPQLIGVYTSLPANSAPAEGLSFHAVLDTRFISTPTSLKFWVLVLGIAATVLSILALAVLDARDGRGHRIRLSAATWRPRWVDGFVGAVLLVWLFVGANTADDGYQVTVGRIAKDAGYLDNYYRYFGAPQDPFGWHYHYLSLWMQISTATPWLRLLPFIFALASWWLISRFAIPRLGRAVRQSTPALWAAALVFLAVWMPYNNGLRVEPLIALGALFTWVCVERSIATGRFLPLTIGIMAAALTLTAHPTGVMAAVALLAGLRPLLRRFMARRKRDGALPLLMPILASGLAILYLIFADQALAPILEGVGVNGEVGPTNKWWEEPLRYYMLMNPTADGSIARRFGMLITFVCAILVVIMLLNRKRLTGIATAPTWRLVAMTLGCTALLAFQPTKWTHQMGIYAAVAGALAAVATACADRAIMRRRRNRTLFAAACVYVLAVAFSGRNQWWYVGNYGMPWRDSTPELKGITFATVFLAIAVALTVLGVWQHFRDDYVAAAQRRGASTGVFSRLRSPSLIAVSAVMLAFTLVSFAKADMTQRHSWSWGKSNVDALRGSPCALAEAVLVEAKPDDGLLVAANVAGQRDLTPGAALAGKEMTGFDPNGVGADLAADESEEAKNEVDRSTSDPSTDTNATGTGTGTGTGTDTTGTDGTADSASGNGSSSDTAGGTGEQVGVNGSRQKLPFGLSPRTTPILGTYGSPGGAGHLVSAWYQMPRRTADRPLITMSVAGQVEYLDDLSVTHKGQTVRVEYGRVEADGSVTPVGQRVPMDTDYAPEWRNLRFPLDQAPPRATVVRVVADDTSAVPDQWVAITPPRMSKTVGLTDLVGKTDPVLLDWSVALAFPCQRPARARYGVLETPLWRIAPDRIGEEINSQRWMAGDYGGPLGIIENELSPTVLPSYLRNDWARDWGSLMRLEPLVPQRTADLTISTDTHHGLWSPGPMRASRNSN